jgi:hypothetical protein
LSQVPGASSLPSSVEEGLVEVLRVRLRAFTDNVLETAELTLNRYQAAKPDSYSDVVVLRDGTATYAELKRTLIDQTSAGKLIDLMILTRGRENLISVSDGISGEMIRSIRSEVGRPLTIRSVYMMNCVGSTLNQAWLDIGAKASAGTLGKNYLPEPTTHFFWVNWKAGKAFETAVTSAYRQTIGVMNETVRGFLIASPIPGASALAPLVDFSDFDFVRASAPVVQGQRTITVNSDDLTFSQSQSRASNLVTTVLPLSLVKSLSENATGGSAGAAPRHPMGANQPPLAQAQFAIAGIAVADAIQIGLGGIALAQAGLSASQGSFTLTYDRAQRLLTPQARAKMPGARAATQSYRRMLFFLGSRNPGLASAMVTIKWDGNPYGEISTPEIERDLVQSTEWSYSSANISIVKLDQIPPDADPRTWPVVFSYTGTYNPFANGCFEFSGAFQIDAFGGIKWIRPHEVVSRAFVDATVVGQPEEYVVRGPDIIAEIPDIPGEQLQYVRENVPG